MRRKGVIIGCGRIGAPLLAWMHSKAGDDFRMNGIEINNEHALRLTKGETGWFEEGMDEYYANNNVIIYGGHLEGLEDAFWKSTDFAVVCLGSPVVGNTPQVNAIKDVISYIPDNVLIVLRSTVPVGFTRELVEETGKQIIFAPERILTGNSMKELETLPQIIGIVDKEKLTNKEAYIKFRGFFNDVIVYSSEEAELAKIGNNIIRYIEFTAGTQFAKACAHHGADWKNVRAAMTDGYERGSMCFPSFTSSYCLNKDFYMLDEEVIPILSTVCEQYNQKFLIIDLLTEAMHNTRAQNIGILGWTYRPNSDDDRDTITEYLASVCGAMLPACDLQVFDPIKMPHYRKADILGLRAAESVEKLIEWSDIIIIATAHDEFGKINKELLSGKTVIDPAGLINNRTKFVEVYE